MAKGDDIQERLINFAIEIIKLSSSLPKTQAGRHIASQILRSGTAPAPNYAEARAAESTNDFIHKLKISLKELNETEIWLTIIVKGNLLEEHQVCGISSECKELCKILGSSIKTALTNVGKL